MVIPLGDWLLISLGLLALIEWRNLHIDPSFRVLPALWLLGFVLENVMSISGPWHWHLSRLLVLLWFVHLAWKRSDGSKLFPLFLTSLTFLVRDLFSINEPGMFEYEQWIFVMTIISVAFFSTQSLWEMAFALAGGMLLNLGFSVFLFNGIVRHYDLPDPFLWHISIAALFVSSVFNPIKNSLKVKIKPVASVSVPLDFSSEEIDSLVEQEPSTT